MCWEALISCSYYGYLNYFFTNCPKKQHIYFLRNICFQKKILLIYNLFLGASLVAQMVKVCLQCRWHRFNPWVRKIPWRKKWQHTPVLLPGKFHGLRSLVVYSPWGHKESDTTERLHFHFSISCIGEGNGNPLQCSCLENPRDGGAWWVAVYGVAQSRTQLKQLSSSSSFLALHSI